MLTNIEAMRLNFMLKNDNKVLEIPIIKIRPNKAQPRKTFDETELAALSASISENGILQPLSVRKISAAEYELVDRKSTSLNSSHITISYAVFCMKKKKKN